ncbi:MAG: hypothetical protein WC044_01630 [Crocinitomicaceae bacterium]
MNYNLQNNLNEQIFTLSEELKIKRLSPSFVRKVNGYLEKTDEEIDSVIDSLYKLSLITLIISQL